MSAFLSIGILPPARVAGVVTAGVLEHAIPAAIFLAIVLVTAAAMIGAGTLLGPRRPTPTKESTYECGVPLFGSARERFSVKFYLVALLFVLFDIETVFLIPWAVSFRELLGSSAGGAATAAGAAPPMGIFAVVEMFVFIGILVIGLLYAWRRGGLEWD